MSGAQHLPRGTHWIADFLGVEGALLSDEGTLRTCLLGAAGASSATALSAHFHAFGNRQGVTGVILLAESHISIHTWPESGYAAIDIFMCGSSSPQRALEYLREGLKPLSVKLEIVSRNGQAQQEQSMRAA